MRNINRLKTSYQRNMLLGQCVAIVLTAIFCLLVMERPSQKTVVKGTLFTNYYINEKDNIQPSKRPARNNIGNWPIKSRTGFLGFNVKFKTIDNIGNQKDAPKIPAVILPNQPYIDPDIVSYSEFDGEMIGLFLTDESDYLYWPEQPPINCEKDVRILNRSDPSYPAVALEAGIEGKVVILVYIDSLGVIAPFPFENNYGNLEYKSYLTIKEEPTDWFFASNLIRELPKWIFSPKIEKGKDIGSFLKITYKYQLTDTTL